MKEERRINRRLNLKRKLLLLFIFILTGNTLLSQEYVAGFENLTHKGNSAFGKKYGKWIVKGTNGKIYQTQFYKNNVPDSIWKTYYPDGQVRNKTKYYEGHIVSWIHLVENSEQYLLTSNDSIPARIIDLIRKHEDLFQFRIYLKNSILMQAEEQGYYAKDKFYENPLWDNTLETDIFFTINSEKGTVSFTSWDMNKNILSEIDFEKGWETKKQVYEYKKSILAKKTYFEEGVKIKTEKYKNGQLAKTIE